MKARDYKLNLWKEFMEKTPYIPERLWETMGQIAGNYVDDTSFLFKIYEALIENERYLADEENEITYERDGEDYILAYQGKECVFSENEFKKILASMLDILEDTLPLGTVVDLNKDAYKGVPQVEDVDKIRMVIIYRFLGKEDQEFYFPYAGVVYPVGMLGYDEVLYFTKPLVEQVIHKGFHDEQEDAYVYLMKQEMIVEKGKNTFGYATPEQIEEFNKQVKKGGENNVI
jgi:hypothetical protein